MVSWAADGLLSGYDSTTKRMTLDRYKFASPGVTDLDGITRLRYALSAYGGRPATGFENALRASASINFTTADLSSNPGRLLTVGMFVANAADFEPGVTPTPTQIAAKATYYAPSDRWVTSVGPTSTTFTFNVAGISASLAAAWPTDTKFWVLLAPISTTNNSFTATNWAPLNGVPFDVIGRALSVWTNRRPNAPTITSPTNNTAVNPGSSFNLSYTFNDPDAEVPLGTGPTGDQYNRDVAGVQVQYAAAPTDANPNPEWRDLDYLMPGSLIGVSEAAYIRGPGSTYRLHDDRMAPILTNAGFTVTCGTPAPVSGNGYLPAGDWQIRVRSFDFGHPYPAEVAPLGVVLSPTTSLSLTNYPDTNTSPWSVPVRVTVLAKVAPPEALSPTNNVATIDGAGARLVWRHRSTYTPTVPQGFRRVQIRKVGDPDWATVFSGPSTLSFVDLPVSIDNPDRVPDIEYLVDGGFEGGTNDFWVKWNPDAAGGFPGTPAINVNDPAKAHTGNRYIETPSDATFSGVVRQVLLNALHDRFRFTAWIKPNDNVVLANYGVTWVDAAGVRLAAGLQPPANPYLNRPASGVWDWTQVDTGDLIPPPGAARADLVFFGISGDSPFSAGRLDDASFYGYTSTNTDDFTLVSGNQYEWRVQTADTENYLSNFSEPARFYVVPQGTSGEEKPILPANISGAALGCGTYRVFVFRRGGKERVGEIRSISRLDWSRVRDDISTARVEISDWDVDCGALLARLQTWAYELVIFRDNGFSVDRVWEGPITLLTYDRERVAIDARDVMVYAYRRIIKQRLSDSAVGATVTDRARRILQNAFAPDDPNVLAYLTTLTRDDDAKQYRTTPAWSRTAFEEIDDMAANAGLDYTAVGRRIILWGTKHRIGTLPEFRDSNLGNSPIVSEYGMSAANLYSVSDGNGAHGEANRLGVSGNDPIYGLIEMLSSTWASDAAPDTGTYTQEGLATVVESFKTSAERSIADRYPPPVVVRVPDNTSVNPDTVLSIQQLVPGVIVPLRSTGTLRTVVASQKLDSVKVVVESGKETISITLSPFSRDDAAAVEGGEA